MYPWAKTASKRKAKRENQTSFTAKRCHLQPSFLVGCSGEHVECLSQDISKTNKELEHTSDR